MQVFFGYCSTTLTVIKYIPEEKLGSQQILGVCNFSLLHAVEAMLVAADAKREDEKAKGVSADNATDNQDVVLYDENEEDEEEENEEEEENNGQESQGRGSGMMWPPQMPMLHGPMMGGCGFPPYMMCDGLGFGSGFGMPDPVGMPCGFPPFDGPRFPGDFPRGQRPYASHGIPWKSPTYWWPLSHGP